jgi:hypothetical protein
MKVEYDLANIRSRKNPYAKQLKKTANHPHGG